MTRLQTLLLLAYSQTADLITTLMGLSRGAVEENPLVGSRPEAWLLLSVKLALIAVVAAALALFPKAPRWPLAIASALTFAACLWNLTQAWVA